MNHVQPSKWIARAVRFALPAAVVLSVWIPLVMHYDVRLARITPEVVEQARHAAPDSVLMELREFRLMRIGASGTPDLVRSAEQLVKGMAVFPGYPAVRIAIPFDSRDLEGVPDAWRLPLAGFVLPRTLLDAHYETGRDDFLIVARDMLVAWGRYERRSWLPRGYLWNDHAIASRIGVLTEFWRLYRGHPRYDAGTGKAILEQVERDAELLARRSHFTFATNHGIMQNLALLHVAVAFPMLPHARKYVAVALRRLREQLPFYLDQDGVVLEHSAGYQRFGVGLIAMACRYLTLLQQPIPEEWRRQFERAQNVLAALRRPDGSLPTFGDTDGASDPVGPFVGTFDAQGRSGPLRLRPQWTPDSALNLYPVAGHVIWWGGLGRWPEERDLRQTVVTWSYFPGHGHKHADEMSVLMWAGGQAWWTNVGYWPYTMAGRSEAESWSGGNAPHLINESGESARRTTLQWLGWSDHLSLVDLVRSGPGPYVARRQVVHLKPDVWLVVDHVSGGDTVATSTTWTTSPDVTLKPGSTPGSYLLESRHRATRLRTFVVTAPPATIRAVKGSWSPFAGWQVIKESPRAAPAIVVEQPARDSWSIMIWALETGRVDSALVLTAPSVTSWKSPDEWSVALGPSGGREIRRQRNRLTIVDGRSRPIETLDLAPGPDVTDRLARTRASLAAAERAYPRFQDLVGRRTKVTLLLLAAFLCQELLFSITGRRRGRYQGALGVLSCIAWVSVGYGLVFFLKG